MKNILKYSNIVIRKDLYFHNAIGIFKYFCNKNFISYKDLNKSNKKSENENEVDINFDFSDYENNNNNCSLKKEIDKVIDDKKSLDSQIVKNDKINDPNEINTIKQNTNKFAKEYFSKLVNAINNLNDGNVLMNEVKEFEVKVNILNKKIDKTNVGMYIFKYDENTMQMSLTSPISGFFRYNYDKDSGFWINEKDNHILDDIVIREFCKHSKDLLLFE